jgi:hypothetical protein
VSWDFRLDSVKFPHNNYSQVKNGLLYLSFFVFAYFVNSLAYANEKLEFKVIKINSSGVLLRVLGTEFPSVGTLLTLESQSEKKLAIRVVKINAEKRSFSAKTIKNLSLSPPKPNDLLTATVVSSARESESKLQKALDRDKGVPSVQCNRKRKSIGIYGGFLDGIGALASGNIAYNLGCFARVHAGYGITPLGYINFSFLHGGMRLFVPGWNLSPTLGINLTQITYQQTDLDYSLADALSSVTAGVAAAGDTKSSTTILYMPIGLDWTSSWGFHVAAGASLAFQPLTLVFFYANLGFFF